MSDVSYTFDTIQDVLRETYATEMHEMDRGVIIKTIIMIISEARAIVTPCAYGMYINNIRPSRAVSVTMLFYQLPRSKYRDLLTLSDLALPLILTWQSCLTYFDLN